MADTNSINKPSERKKANVTIGTVTSGAIGAGDSATTEPTSSATTSSTTTTTTTTNRGVKPSFLGIKDSEKGLYRDTLQTAAATDFWHDFHHAKSGPILSRLGKSYNVNSGLSVRAYQTKILSLRNKYPGGTLYEMFQDISSNLMLLTNDEQGGQDGKAKDLRYPSEDAVLDSLLPDGYKYQTIRNKLLNAQGLTLNIYPSIPIGPKAHPYSIVATAAKVSGQPVSIATSFEKVSNGTRNFILMIDASFLAMSKILQLREDDTNTYNFFILESVENEGDPATKIGKFDLPQNPNVNVYFLKDTGHKTYYTPYDANGDNSNLFCGCSISAYRDSDGLITADIKSPTIDTTIDNIGTASEPNEAGFLAFQRLLVKGVEKKDEAFVYYLLKRAGDWCQALCLLDRGRSYSIYAYGSNEVRASGTLEQIMNNEVGLGVKAPFEIALLTHDKILLSYALSLGLNVFYTIKTVASATLTSSGSGGTGGAGGVDNSDESSSSVTWLTYFKNTLDSNPEAILNAADDKLNTVKKDVEKIYLNLTNSSKDFSTIDRNALDADISAYYNSIPSTVLSKINETKTLADDGKYKLGFLTDFLSTTRAVLDIATKIAAKPTTSINDVLTNAEAANKNANTYFSAVSAAETTVHTYLQIVKFIQKLRSLTEEQIPQLLQEEYTKIQQLEAVLQSQSNIVLQNKAYVEPYQYFLFTTLPAIQKDRKSFETMFGMSPVAVVVGAVGAGAGDGLTLKSALTLEMEKYTIRNREQPRGRTFGIWKSKIETWHAKYNEALQLPRVEGVQSGGGELETLLTQKWIKTREANTAYFEDGVILDVGTTITFNDGLGYTLLDNCIVTKDEEPLLLNLIQQVSSSKSPKITASIDNSNTNAIVFYRYILFKLDYYTNKVNSLGLVIDDADESGNSSEPYYTEEHNLYLQKIAMCLEKVNALLTNMELSLQPSLSYDLNEEEKIVQARQAVISKDELLTNIALLKLKLVTDFIRNTGDMLDEYQTKRLAYLLSPSIENTESYDKVISLLMKKDLGEEGGVAGAAGAGAGAAPRGDSRKRSLTEKMLQAEEAAKRHLMTPQFKEKKKREAAQAIEDVLSGLFTTQAKFKEQRMGQKKRVAERHTSRNVTFKELSKLRRALLQQGIRMQASQGQAGGKRFSKTRSKPKIRKHTRRVQKKYRNKTKRLFKI